MLSWLARKWEEGGRRRQAALAAIPLAAADRIATRLLHIAPTPTPIDVSSDEAIDRYTSDLVSRAAGCSFHFPALWFPNAVSMLGPAPEGRLVAMLADDPVLVMPGSLRVRSPASESEAPSVAHLVCDALLALSELEALAADPEGFDLAVEPPPPERLSGSPLATRALPIAGDLFAGAVALVAGLVGLGLCLALALAGGPPEGLADALGRFGVALLFGTLAAMFVRAGAETVARVLWLERRALRLRVDEHGLTHPLTDARVAWGELREVTRGRIAWRVVLPDGHRFALPATTFRDPDAALAEIRARKARTRSSYRD